MEAVIADQRPDQALVELAAERDGDLVAGHLGQQLDHVLGVELDRDRLGVELGLELLADLAEVGVVAVTVMPSYDANARLAVGDREQDGVGRRARDLDWPGVACKYLAGSAQDGW